MTKVTLTQYIRSCRVLLTFYSLSDSFLFVHLFLSILKGERELVSQSVHCSNADYCEQNLIFRDV
jgi:hypothetical protein